MKRLFRTYNVSTSEKKNVYTTSTYVMPDEGVAAGKTFYIHEIYRWGNAQLETVAEGAIIEESSDPYDEPLYLGNYDILDQDLQDGCSLEFEFEEGDEWSEEERKFVEELFDNNSYTAFEEHGISFEDFDCRFYGPLDIEFLSEEEREVPKSTWPF